MRFHSHSPLIKSFLSISSIGLISIFKLIILSLFALTTYYYAYYAWKFSADVLRIGDLVNEVNAKIVQKFNSPQRGYQTLWKIEEDDVCLGELMRYSIFDSLDLDRAKLLYKAKKRFECDHLKYLKKFKLSDKHKLEDKKVETPNFVPVSKIREINQAETPKVIVTAASIKYYYSARAVIAGIQSTFAKKTVTAKSPPKIIFYDLGGITDDKEKKMELKSVCNLEYRIFDWKLLPDDVHGLENFSWKIIILAEMFQEFDSFIYLDTSINFLEKAQMSPQYAWKEPDWKPNDRFGIYTKMYREGLISPVSFTRATERGIRYATHQDMFSYIPLDPTFDFAHDIEMYHANFIIIHKTEMARQLLKWSVLCAVTRDCIQPDGAKFEGCDNTNARKDLPGSCHRFDQSILSVLINNLEMTMSREGSITLVHQSPYNHPIRYYHAHTVERKQLTTKKLRPCE